MEWTNGMPLTKIISINNRIFLWVVLRSCGTCWVGTSGITLGLDRNFLPLTVERSGPNAYSAIISSSAEKGQFSIEFLHSNYM